MTGALHPTGAVLAGVVLWTMNEWYAVDIDGAEWRCRLRGTLRRHGHAAVLPVAGDRVRVTVTDPSRHHGVIERVEARSSVFSRRAAGGKGTWREQVLAANIDQVFVVFAAADPAPHLRAVDRFLVIAEANELEARLIVNKVDLTGEAAARALFNVYGCAGYEVCYTSAATGLGLEQPRTWLAGRITLIAGPSGVGKSSLINALVPGIDLRTGEVSAALHKGRHTTVVGALHPLPEPTGGYVADTPGLRELAPWDIPSDQVSDCFPEMRPFQDACRWPGCLHRNEGDCAVKAAVQAGAVSAARYDSYLRLLDDILEHERRVRSSHR